MCHVSCRPRACAAGAPGRHRGANACKIFDHSCAHAHSCLPQTQHGANISTQRLSGRCELQCERPGSSSMLWRSCCSSHSTVNIQHLRLRLLNASSLCCASLTRVRQAMQRTKCEQREASILGSCTRGTQVMGSPAATAAVVDSLTAHSSPMHGSRQLGTGSRQSELSDAPPPGLRICSLLPSATDIVGCLGLAEHLVCVTHECDTAPDEATLQRLISEGTAVRCLTICALP